MKKLHTFTIEEEPKTDKSETSKNQSGEEITTIRKVTEKIARRFFLRRPNRALADSADLFYGEKYADAFRKGLLPRAVIEKKLIEQGVFTEEERKRSEVLGKEILDLQERYQKALLKPETERSDEDKSEVEVMKTEFADKSNEYARIEMVRSNLFVNTVETYARNQLAIWWTLQLSYREKEGGKEEPYFPGSTHEEKLKKYDELAESGTPLDIEAAQRFMLYSTFWLFNRDREVPREEFESLDKGLSESEGKQN